MRTLTTFGLVGVLALAACSTAAIPTTTIVPTPVPTVGPTPVPTVGPTPVPTVGPTEAPTVAPTEAPTVAPTEVPTVAPASPTADDLLSGVRSDLKTVCAPLGTDLPKSAIAGVECTPKSGVVGHVTLYLFSTQQDLLDAYMAQLADHKVQLRSGDECVVGKTLEGAYVPGDGLMLPNRNGCYLDESGKVHYVATLPPFVLAKVDGKVGDSAAVWSWAWAGNQDTPGSPTVWRSNAP